MAAAVGCMEMALEVAHLLHSEPILSRELRFCITQPVGGEESIIPKYFGFLVSVQSFQRSIYPCRVLTWVCAPALQFLSQIHLGIQAFAGLNLVHLM